MTTEARARRWSRPEWASVILAALSLASAIVFNGVQVARSTQEARRSTEQTRLSRQTAQLELLDSVGLDYGKARDAGTNSAFVRNTIAIGKRLDDSSAWFSAVQLEATLAERLAYMFNHRYITLPAAIQPGGLVCTWRRLLAAAPRYYATYIYWHGGLRELRSYAHRHPSRYRCQMPKVPRSGGDPGNVPAAPEAIS